MFIKLKLLLPTGGVYSMDPLEHKWNVAQQMKRDTSLPYEVHAGDLNLMAKTLGPGVALLAAQQRGIDWGMDYTRPEYDEYIPERTAVGTINLAQYSPLTREYIINNVLGSVPRMFIGDREYKRVKWKVDHEEINTEDRIEYVPTGVLVTGHPDTVKQTVDLLTALIDAAIVNDSTLASMIKNDLQKTQLDFKLKGSRADVVRALDRVSDIYGDAFTVEANGREYPVSLDYSADRGKEGISIVIEEYPPIEEDLRMIRTAIVKQFEWEIGNSGLEVKLQ